MIIRRYPCQILQPRCLYQITFTIYTVTFSTDPSNSKLGQMSEDEVATIELNSLDKQNVQLTVQSSSENDSYKSGREHSGALEGNKEDEEDLEIDLRDPKTFKWVLTSLWTNSALSALDGTIVSTTVNDVASRFQQASMVTWVATAYLLTTTAAQPLYGKISDIIGRRKCLLFGEIVFAVGVGLCIFSKSIPQLAIARGICGIGGSGTGAMTNIILSDMAPLSERGKYWGYGSMLGGVFQSLGGPLGGILLTYFGVSGLFIPQIPFCLATLYLSWKYVQDYNQDTKGSWKRIDFGGSICLLVGISSFIFFFSADENPSISEHSGWSPYKKWSFAIFVLFTILFLVVEKYVALENIIPMEVLKGTLGLLAFIQGLVSMINYTELFIVPLFLQLVWGISVSTSGAYIVCIVISYSVGSLLSGALIKKVAKPSRESTIYYSGVSIFYMSLISMVGYYFLDRAVRYTKPVYGDTKVPESLNFQLIFGITLLGLCQGSQGVTIMLYNVAKVGRKGQASSTSVQFLFRSLGNVLSVSLAFNVFTNALRKTLGKVLAGKNDELFALLLKDNAFLRNKDMPTDDLDSILEAFHKALVSSFVPCIWCLILSVIFSGVLWIAVRKQYRSVA
ncbi:hypothetical protein ZYGR_0AD06870 [Zygosaccharomyces rouxii]|uniref:Major facilitator superfamily (MFS) profile domain-containing protein n=1 Tax=Zygosaccharomyces rouxii TaxID=4956 RepID=A0A1Q3A6Z7_ZYGRO|nr:hypothetical protein ZYGR_0AD06870 [Zygosaccharomyces rouxii]